MDREDIVEKLRKLMELARRGEGGEASNARAAVDRMMRQHGITEADLDDNAPRWLTYIIDKEEEITLLIIVLTNVLKVPQAQVRPLLSITTLAFGGWHIKVRLTIEQHAVASALYEHHKHGLERSYANVAVAHADAARHLKADIAAAKKAYEKLKQSKKEESADYRRIRKNMLNAYLNENEMLEYAHCTTVPAAMYRDAAKHTERVGTPNGLPPQAIGDGSYIKGSSRPEQASLWD